tara:strand:- start:192 stop:455 length:264 start_codon:yes stop_codon:yes gene_type:complete
LDKPLLLLIAVTKRSPQRRRNKRNKLQVLPQLVVVAGIVDLIPVGAAEVVWVLRAQVRQQVLLQVTVKVLAAQQMVATPQERRKVGL